MTLSVCYPPVQAPGADEPRSELPDHLQLQNAASLPIHDPLVLSGGFSRTKLHMVVRRHVEDADKHDAVVERAVALTGPGLV